MDDQNEAARRVAERFWEDLLGLEPLIGTMVGDERFDDKLSDPGPEGRARSKDVHAGGLEALLRFDSGRTQPDWAEAIHRSRRAR